MPLLSARIAKLAMVMALLPVGMMVDSAPAQPSPGDVKVQYNRHTLSISANHADLKRVLKALAEITDITIEYPVSLEKKITLNRRGVTIEDALDAMLIGINHIIFFSGPRQDRAKITRVAIFGKAARRQPNSARQKRLARRIESYKRQIAAWQRRLSTMDAGSTRGRRYAERIRRLEQRIERLERQF